MYREMSSKQTWTINMLFSVQARIVKSLEENCEDQLHLPDEMVKEFSETLTSLRHAMLENDNFLQYYSNRKV